MVEILKLAVHGALVAAVGELPDVARTKHSRDDVLAVVELEALHAHVHVLLDQALPPGEGVRIGQVDGRAPLVQQQPALRRVVALLGRFVAEGLSGVVLLVQVGRVPQSGAEAERVHLVDHRLCIGKLRRVEVEGVHGGGVRAIDPIRTGGKIQRADRGQVAFDLSLVVVFVAPNPGAQRPAGGQAWRAGGVVVPLGDVEGAVGGKQVKCQPFGGGGAGAEGDLRASGVFGGDVESRGVGVFDEEPPAARADE